MSLIDLIKDNIPQIVEFVDKAESLFLYFVLFLFSLAVLIVFIGYIYGEIKSGEAIDNIFLWVGGPVAVAIGFFLITNFSYSVYIVISGLLISIAGALFFIGMLILFFTYIVPNLKNLND
ncbi:hypothetical protein E4H54_23795 [Salmonella enterica]|uniref:Uncharacterized protein n=2 Tax=Salmonella enterica TaxID=28901 RepID=A0A613QPJ8_SALER|nr:MULTISPECIES: hypothetical protein [Enterobacteriaceae]EAA1702780.1 hypothetical protein [Salmonella enterica subsp. enterica serovar Enteritidis]EAO9031970.1 hypothetical protein [Salmonella enterica]EBV0970751.1 hypothetical protein [Salmonella enterica subsp. enterica serovar Virchow]EDB1765283.1 hypothetical protein [Salmonella enterica subsp. enterica serovar Brancaster]EDM3423386.1 hypothetical protein [Salmonella enterica subsp. enterica serovar Newport]EDS4597684.1 hypothetical pro